MSENCFITLPISEFQALADLPSVVEDQRKELVQVRRELEGLRTVQNQSLLKLADVLREMNKL